MAIFRQVHISYWQDKFVLSLTPEEKFFYLYLLTNSKTKQCGIYELPLPIIQVETGYNRETVIKLIQKFIDHKKVSYDWENEEIFLLNWMKHNPITNKNIEKCIIDELSQVHNKEMIPLASPLQALIIPLPSNKNKNKNNNKNNNKNKEEESIQSLWVKTFGRNPKHPEVEETQKLIDRFGEPKVYQIFKTATLTGFKNLGTLINSLDEHGNIKPREDSKKETTLTLRS